MPSRMLSRWVSWLGLVAVLGACAGSRSPEIGRERAIEIARQQADFEVRYVEAVRDRNEERPVWRVTLRGREPGPDHPMGEFLMVLVDRRTGEVVSVGMS